MLSDRCNVLNLNRYVCMISVSVSLKKVYKAYKWLNYKHSLHFSEVCHKSKKEMMLAHLSFRVPSSELTSFFSMILFGLAKQTFPSGRDFSLSNKRLALRTLRSTCTRIQVYLPTDSKFQEAFLQLLRDKHKKYQSYKIIIHVMAGIHIFYYK